MAWIEDIIDFIRDLYGARDFVPLSAPIFLGNEKKYLAECIDSGFVSSVGRFVDLFEEQMAEYTGSKRAVACVNGTCALHIALILAGVEPGDEVLTQALTFVATCNAICYTSAKPIFIDIDRDTLSISPEAIDAWLEENAEIKHGECRNKKTGARIKACVPMHTFGHPAKLDQLMEVCQKWHLMLVEDAAESIGSLYKGRHAGTFGKIGVISFNGNKTITTGGGGMLLLQDEQLGKMAKHLTTQAKRPHPWESAHDMIGYNYRMPNINAALGCAQLEHIEQYIENKRQTAMAYKTFFENFEGIDFLAEPEGCRSNYWLNAIVLKDKATAQEFLQSSNEHGVMSRPAWRPMNQLQMFADCQSDALNQTQWFADRIVNIPSSVRL